MKEDASTVYKSVTVSPLANTETPHGRRLQLLIGSKVSDINTNMRRITQARQWPYALSLASLLFLFTGSDAKLPNMLYIMADDMGFNDVSWNNPDVITPNMQKMVDDGVILNFAYAQAACTPSRAAYLTGYYPFRIGVQNAVVREGMVDYVPLDFPFLPERLKEAGYTSHLIGKWHLGHCREDVTPVSRGFDSFLGLYGGYNNFYTKKIQMIGSHEDFDPNADGTVYDFFVNHTVYPSPETDYTTDVFTDRTIELIQQYQDSPFFIALHYTAPHWPLLVPPQYLEYYPSVSDADRRTYLAMVTAMDEGIGKIIQTLEDENLMDNTIVFFVSDNGGDTHFGASNEPLRERKTTLFEGGTRVPGFVYSPAHLANTPRVSQDLFHMVDWFSTILGIAGVDPGNVDGMNQWDMLRYGVKSPRDTFIYNIYGENAAIRAGRYKLIEGDPYEFQARRRKRSAAERKRSTDNAHARGKRDCEPERPESAVDKMMKAFNELSGPANITEDRRKGGWTMETILELMETYLPADVSLPADCDDCQLYDVLEDPTESQDLAELFPGVVLYLHTLLQLYQAEEVDPVLEYPYHLHPRFPNTTVVNNTWCQGL